MFFHERTLPHYYPPEAILFLTWRLFDSPWHPLANADAGRAFVQNDRLLRQAASGSRWLKDPCVARLIAEALEQGEVKYRLHERFAWVIMPNHVQSGHAALP
jgi:hypothetical protein